MKKKCTKCGVEKSLEDFHKNKKGKFGRESNCKLCRVSLHKEYYEANKDKIDSKNKAYREDNKEKISAYGKSYHEANKRRINEKKRAYYEANKEKINARQKSYREANKGKIAEQRKVYREANKEKINELNKAYKKKRYAEDPIFRAMKSLRKQTERLGDHKNKSTIELVGCSPESFWVMNGSPEDMSDIHVDHIVPLSWFDLTNEDHLKVCSHWSNLQYLCGYDNRSKNNRYAGSPGNVLGYKDDFDIEQYVQERIELC